jgi:hypothetical protein
MSYFASQSCMCTDTSPDISVMATTLLVLNLVACVPKHLASIFKQKFNIVECRCAPCLQAFWLFHKLPNDCKETVIYFEAFSAPLSDVLSTDYTGIQQAV